MALLGYPVYRLTPQGTEVVRVGTILEFRRSRRSMNRLGLAKLAQRLFARDPGDIIVVGTDSALRRAELEKEFSTALSAG